MTTILTIPTTELRRLIGLLPGDSSQDAALEQLQAAEQPVVEYALSANALLAATVGFAAGVGSDGAPTSAVAAIPPDAGLLATLTLGAAEALAGSYLVQMARSAGFADDFHIGPLEVTASKTSGPAVLGPKLLAQGAARLAPWAKAPATKLTLTPKTAAPAQDITDLLAPAPLVPSPLPAIDPSFTVLQQDTPSLFHWPGGGAAFLPDNAMPGEGGGWLP